MVRSSGFKLLIAVTVMAVAAGGVFTLLTLKDLDDAPQRVVAAEELEVETEEADQAQPPRSPSLDERLKERLEQAQSEEEKIGAIEDYVKEPSARSDSAVLRSSMLMEDSATVRVRAFEATKELALREDRSALINVLSNGVGNPYADVRRESIRACRDHPHYELMDELLNIVERGGSDRSVAIQALAFLDDPEAQKKVLETAQSTELPRPDRIQAIALLSRTDLDEGVSYLQELATGDDHELQKFALEALSIWQKRKTNN